MIVVRVELQSAQTGKTTELGLARIVNDETGSGSIGNYDVELRLNGNQLSDTQRVGRVEGYARESRDVWELVQLAIASVRSDQARRDWRAKAMRGMRFVLFANVAVIIACVVGAYIARSAVPLSGVPMNLFAYFFIRMTLTSFQKT